MSLFGDSPPGRSRSSLFADEEFESAPGSLFDDSGAGAWNSAGLPTARRGAPTDISKTLLTKENANIPERYDFLYESFSDQFGSPGGGVALAGVKQVLKEADADGYGIEDRILSILIKGGKQSIGREEFYVLLALVGLEQQGEEVTIDGVDDSRKSEYYPLQPGSRKERIKCHDLPTSTTPVKVVHRQQSTPISTAPTRPRNAAGIFGAESDPWGSPEMHENHDHVNQQDNRVAIIDNSGSNRQPTPPTERNTFEYTPSADASRTSASSWGVYDAPQRQDSLGGSTYNQSAVFGESNPGRGQRHGSFGGLGGNSLNGSAPTITGSDGGGLGRMRVPRGPEEVVTVTVLPEKEGMFMFQHRNYQIASARRQSRVVRRYSDFVWLLDCLHKRFPFRQLPLLPPKRLAVNGHYLSADAAFLERRRRGLSRFANAIVRHPVLSQEQLVIMFLTVPTELSVWRKQANLSVQEEFSGKALPPGLEERLPQNLENTFDMVRSGLRKSSEIYIQLCNLVERLEKRQEGIAADYMRFSGALRSLTDVSEATYAVDTSEIPLLNDGLTAVAKHLSQSQSLIEDETKAWDQGVLEDLKRQRDCLISMRELFERKDRYAVDNIPQLERRIKQNEAKLEMLRHRTEPGKPGEEEKVQESISRDKKSIVDQHARGVLIKECIRDELVYFQNSQYHVARLHQDWSQERVKYAELHADNWRSLCNEAEGMPLGE
ncbi:unnamed protein product [Tuber melanosporum]|uniref:Sorting nexin MVP1 n=1 Tax=Tuber melanosporum (strain Mel28) TaxID=656061 RepID=D5GLF4_TUBMM|nr:uncharacterized protein GSTUM_00010171001 [Tuber melanosporum]CAZ85347.1 unnamed protein product [Tuber melanosporum]